MPITLRPGLSSFALERSVATSFSGYGSVPAGEHHALITAAVPAVRILSTPVTGMSALLEQEVCFRARRAAGWSVCAELQVAPPGERVC